MPEKITNEIINSFPVLQAETDKYRSTRGAKESDIIELWNYAVGREADKACLVSVCGLVSTPVSSMILSSQSLYNFLAIYGAPVAKMMTPTSFEVLTVLVMGAPMIASITANTIGIGRLFRVLSAAITEKKAPLAASAGVLPRNPRVRRQALGLISDMGKNGERISAVRFKPLFVDWAKHRLGL